MAKPIRIDFVADPGCPWCAIGAHSLVQAINKVGADTQPTLFVRPFQINPEIGPQGELLTRHAASKFGAAPEEIEAQRYAVAVQASERGFEINQGPESRIWNTADANRLLYWAGVESNQALNLLLALFRANFTDGRSLSEHGTLIDCARKVGLDPERARAVLSSKQFEQETRDMEKQALMSGVVRVPTVVLDERHRVEGAQPPQLYAQTIRDVMNGEFQK